MKIIIFCACTTMLALYVDALRHPSLGWKEIDDSLEAARSELNGLDAARSKPCAAEPACRFRQDNGKKALPKGEPGTDGYCATCECTGKVSKDNLSCVRILAELKGSKLQNFTAPPDDADYRSTEVTVYDFSRTKPCAPDSADWAEPDCCFGQAYIENRKKALPKGEPGTDGYCAACKCTGEVKENKTIKCIVLRVDFKGDVKAKGAFINYLNAMKCKKVREKDLKRAGISSDIGFNIITGKLT